MKTTRQRIIELLEGAGSYCPTNLSRQLRREGRDASPQEVVEHVRQAAESVEGIEVAPPKCRDCGFEGFDRPVNLPSQCPECRSEWIEEPRFRKV